MRWSRQPRSRWPERRSGRQSVCAAGPEHLAQRRTNRAHLGHIEHPTQVRVWDAMTGVPLTDRFISSNPISSVWFSPDGQWLLADGHSWEIHIPAGLPVDWLPDLAEAVAGEKTKTCRVSGPASAKTFARIRARLAPLSATNRLIAWAREFVSDDLSTPPR